MLSPATRFQRLAQQFDTLVGNINDAQDPKERKRLLRRMKTVIDEIDAHLHVALQAKALPLLTSFFPNLQFIVSTHSPFVITSISNAVVFDLENKILIEDPSKYSVDSINKTYFNVAKYSQELRGKLERYEALDSQTTRNEPEQLELVQLTEYFNSVPTLFAPELESKILDIQLKRLLSDQHKKTN